MEDTITHGDEPEAPLAVQWGVTPSTRVWVGGHNVVARREIEKCLAGASRPPSDSIDVAFITPQSIDEALYFANKLRSRLAPDGAIWVAVPGPTASTPHGAVDEIERLTGALVDAGWVAHGMVRIGATHKSVRFKPV